MLEVTHSCLYRSNTHVLHTRMRLCRLFEFRPRLDRYCRMHICSHVYIYIYIYVPLVPSCIWAVIRTFCNADVICVILYKSSNHTTSLLIHWHYGATCVSPASSIVGTRRVDNWAQRAFHISGSPLHWISNNMITQSHKHNLHNVTYVRRLAAWCVIQAQRALYDMQTIELLSSLSDRVERSPMQMITNTVKL